MRLGENINDPNSVFQTVNSMFDMLPLAAAIEDKFLCINSGIGSIPSLMEIKNIERPVKVKDSETVVDLLWSGCGGNKSLGYNSNKLTDDEMEPFL